MHRVFGVKLGPCVVCLAKLEEQAGKEAPARESPPATQQDLF